MQPVDHELVLQVFDAEIAELERQLAEKQESRREYINRNNLNKVKPAQE